MARSVTVAGVVGRFFWTNPHAYIFLDGHEEASASETPQRWRLELEASAVLRRKGWTEDAIQPGDRIRCTGARAKIRDSYLMKCFSVELADGRKLASQ